MNDHDVMIASELVNTHKLKPRVVARKLEVSTIDVRRAVGVGSIDHGQPWTPEIEDDCHRAIIELKNANRMICANHIAKSLGQKHDRKISDKAVMRRIRAVLGNDWNHRMSERRRLHRVRKQNPGLSMTKCIRLFNRDAQFPISLPTGYAWLRNPTPKPRNKAKPQPKG